MTDSNPNADVIEKDIVRTQNDISDTVNELQEKLQPKQLLRQVVGDPQQVPTQLFDAVKRNPVAAGLIAVGALWLLSGNQPKMPKMPKLKSGKKTRSYDEHVASVVRYEGESDEVYQTRLDIARGEYFDTSRGSDEHASSFRQRLDGLTQGLRDRAKSVGGNTGDRISGLRSSIGDRSRSAASWSSAKHSQDPFATGIAAAAAGAIAGFSLPKTQVEREKLAPLRDTAMAKATELKDQAMQLASEKLGSDTGGQQVSNAGGSSQQFGNTTGSSQQSGASGTPEQMIAANPT